MIKVQLWENKELYKANEGLEKPIIGLLLESTFDKFKYLKHSIKCAGPNKTFIAVSVDVFNSSILGFAYREVHWANSEHEKDLWQKLIDDFDTHKFDNYKDRIVVIKEV
jgi:hypothetical protein